MANRNVKLKNKIGDVLYPYTDNIPTASTSTAGKVKLDSSPTSDSNNALTSGGAYTALSSKANDSAVVHKTGNETVAGTKTFSSTVNATASVGFVAKYSNNTKCALQITDVTKGTTPEAAHSGMYMICDSAGTGGSQGIARFEGQYATSGNTYAALYAYTALSGVSTVGGIRAVCTADNTYRIETNGSSSLTNASLTTVTNSTTSVIMPTMGWVNNPETATNVVHRTSSETIGGAKTLSETVTISGASKQLKIKNTGITRGTAPSAAVNSVVVNGLDNAGKSTWGLYHTWGTDQKAQVQLICYKGTTTDNTWSGIGVGYDASGNAFTSAVTPGVADSSTKIATTAYINTKFKKVSALPSSPNANTYYFIPE